MNRAMVFDDETIQKLFGFEDAESESIEVSSINSIYPLVSDSRTL